jgi:prepilin peptidase CpaA
MSQFVYVFFTLFSIVALVIAFFDFLFYRIPNVLVAFGGLLFLGFISLGALSGFDWGSLKDSLIIGGLTFLAGLIFYLLKWMGAGDVKFMTLTSLWSAYVGSYFAFLMMMSLAGGGIAVLCYFFPGPIDRTRLKVVEVSKNLLKGSGFFMKYANDPFIHMETGERRNIKVPYGIAIFCGAIFVNYVLLKG